MFNEVSYSRHHSKPISLLGGPRRAMTGFGDLGNQPNYVFAGARIYWAGNVNSLIGSGFSIPGVYSSVPSWGSVVDRFQAGLNSEFHGVQLEANENAKSLGVNVTAPGDFADLQDVKGLIDGIAGSSGFSLSASMARFISNPRSDQGSTPDVGGGNLSTGAPSSDPFTVAANFWGTEIGNTASSFWGGLTGESGEGGGMNMLVIAGLAIAAVVLLKK